MSQRAAVLTALPERNWLPGAAGCCHSRAMPALPATLAAVSDHLSCLPFRGFAGPAPSPSPAGPDLQGPRYDRPTYLSVPISYCLYFDTNCTGLEAANYFCANVTTSLLGTSYTAAADFSAPLPVPPDPDPRAISTVSPAFNITCSSHYSSCSTFEYITCA